MTLILIVIAAAWGVWMWKRPALAFSFLPLVLPTYVIRTNIGPLPTTLLELIILATVIGWIWGAGRGARGAAGITSQLKDAWETFRPWRWVAGLWIISGFIGVFVASDHLGALGLYRAYFIEPLAIFFIGLHIRNTEFRIQNAESRAPACHRLREAMAGRPRSAPRAPLLASSLALIAIILGLYVIVQILTGWGIPDPWNAMPGRRAVGPFPFPNALALFVTPIAAFLFADLVRGWKKKGELRPWLISPWLSIPGYLLSLVSIILAQSDGGLIAIGAASLLVLLLNKRTRMIGFGLAIAGTILVSCIAPLRERATTVLLFREWSSKVRIVMWQETIQMLKDRPIFGAGLGGYPSAIAPYHKATWMEIFQYPHNILLNLWSETGLLGLFVFGWILWKWVTGEKGSRPYALPIITALLVHGLVDVPYFKNDLAVLFWLLVLVSTKENCAQTSTK